MDDARRQAREARAAARRRSTAGGVYQLGEEPPAQLPTAQARLATMWALARDAWLLSGRSLPSYTRAEAPGRVIRPGDEA
ncbi:MAG: hypothetical protein H6740_02980 [Alphaproteobacteria bacterium]|nr:hypothetical protein [Alphaproteobacteria bacterium]